MEQYIPKSVLLAKIEKIQNEFSDSSDRNGNFDDLENQGAYKALDRLESSLDTLEVKEVDLEKEIKRFTMSKELYEADSVIKAVAEHFFELGLKAQKGE